MLKITDGRDAFFQWDTSQTLTVENEPGKTVAEVHIGHEHGNVYSFEPVDGVVTVPDELLQCSDKIVAFEWIKIDNGGYTTRKYTFHVAKRPKVDNYTYTPTKAQSWEYWSDLAKSYAERAEVALSEVPGAMRDYWREHKDDFKGDPGPRGETGPQGVQGIPGVAGLRGPQGEPGRDGIDGKDGKDGRDGIDATPYDDTEIRGEINKVNDSITELTRDKADKTALDSKVGFTDYASNTKGGVFKTGDYGLKVNANGVAYADGYSASQLKGKSNNTFISKVTLENVLAERLKEPQFELIETIESDGSTIISRSAEPNGTPYNFKLMRIIAENNGNSSSYIGVNAPTFAWNNIATQVAGHYWVADLFIERGLFNAICRYGTRSGANDSLNTVLSSPTKAIKPMTSITAISFYSALPSGTNIKIYGIRA